MRSKIGDYFKPDKQINHEVIVVKDKNFIENTSEQDAEKEVDKTDYDDKKEDKIVDYYNQIFKYPNTLMRISGIYHQKSDKKLLKAYCLFVLVITWASFFKMFSAFDFFRGKTEEFSATLVLKIVFVLYSFSCALGPTCIFINQELKSRESDLITQLNILLNKEDDVKKRLKSIKKIILIVYAFFFPSVLLIAYFCCYLFLAR